MRPANLVTAVADILAGIAISGFFFQPLSDLLSLFLLVFSTIGLYGGGVVMNDFFDAALDAVERPERPIPSGLISKTEAMSLGLLLLVIGIGFAFAVSMISGVISILIAVAAVVYDKWAKHHPFLGPLLMGVCRGLNLLLGLSIIPSQMAAYSFLGIIPVVYIAAITMISQGEVRGGKRPVMAGAMVLYAIAMAGVFYVSFFEDNELIAALFIVLWAIMVFLPLRNAWLKPEGRMIGRAVKAGVLALILMNAAWAAAFGAIYVAFIIVLLLPLSMILAKIFAVT